MGAAVVGLIAYGLASDHDDDRCQSHRSSHYRSNNSYRHTSGGSGYRGSRHWNSERGGSYRNSSSSWRDHHYGQE